MEQLIYRVHDISSIFPDIPFSPILHFTVMQNRGTTIRFSSTSFYTFLTGEIIGGKWLLVVWVNVSK